MNFLVRMRLLGGFALEYQNMPVTIPSQRIQALLAYLVLHRTEAQPRQRLAFLLWPDSSESQAHTNLRTLLHRLLTVFPQAEALLRIDAQEIAWKDSAALVLDVADFEQAIRQTSASDPANDQSSVIAALEGAISSYGGDLLPDCYDEWLVPVREQLRLSLFTAIEQLTTRLEQRRSYAEAIPYARRLVSLDPLNEEACLTLMRLYTLNGDRASALRVYHTCASALQTELGTIPGAVLNGAYERLLAAEASPLDTSATGMNAAPLIGRVREWKRMQTTWQAAAAGQSRLLILWGEAGIGKTRLAEDLLIWANRQGIITAVTRCYAAEGDLAYAPVATLLRSEVLRPGIARLSREWQLEISRLAPDLTEARPSVRPLTEGWQRQRLFEALARAVLATQRSLILLVDDLQWCDRDTLEWLHYLLRYQPGARLLVIGTIRAEEVDAGHALLKLLEALRRESHITEISLDPLSQEETAELAVHVAGHTLSQERNAHLYQETEGNPLFVVEMLRAPVVVEAPANAHASSDTVMELPPSVQAVVARRLNLLSPSARAILEVASVIGRSFTFEVIAQTVDLDEDSIVRGLDELWQRRVVREQGSDAYDFTHGKLRAVAYAELSATRQRILHRRVAEALEHVSADLDAVSGQIAMHFQQARLTTQAVIWYRRAADYARHLYANDLAIIHLQQALALLGDDAPEAPSLYDQLGEVQHFIGRYEHSRDSWQHALALTPESDGLPRAERYRKLGNAWRDQYHYDEAQASYDAAETALGSLDDNADATLWRCWGQINLERVNVFYWRGQTAEMLQLIAQLQSQFEQRGTYIQQAHLYQMSLYALLRHNRYAPVAQAVETARIYFSMIEQAGEVGALPSGHFLIGFVELWAGNDLNFAEQEIGTALVLAQQTGDISLEGRCLTYLTVIARMRGALDQVRDYAERSLRVAEAAKMYEYVGAALGNFAWLEWRKGDIAAARIRGQAALEAWKRVPIAYMMEWVGRWPLIGAALAEDDLSEALAQARVLLEEQQKRMPAPIESLFESAVHAANTGDLAASRAFLEQAADLAPQFGYL